MIMRTQCRCAGIEIEVSAEPIEPVLLALLQSRCKFYPCNGSIRARSRSTPARPYMARLSVFNLLI